MTQTQIKALAGQAKKAADTLAGVSSKIKDNALVRMAQGLRDSAGEILKANKKDIALQKGLSKALIDRLTLDTIRIQAMADGLLGIAALKDPIGEVTAGWQRPNGLWIQKVRVPIGVVAIIYEARPNVTSDCIGLCLKSGNVCILKGGSEALNTNRAISKILLRGAKEAGIPEAGIHFIDSQDRKVLNYLLAESDSIDLIIPRGGEGLIRFVQEHSRIPVIKHYKGVCHVYVDEFADLKMAEEICFNAKVQRPGVCNAMESLLVHKKAAERFLPSMSRRYQASGVEIRGCPETVKIVKGIKKAKEMDWSTEYLDLILSLKVVESLEQAITHINHYGSHHSDAIVTERHASAMEFLRRIDSACVYVNASTRFTDGFEFGLGAEIGISTDKIHARGPMALEELTTYKYMIFGNGQVRV